MPVSAYFPHTPEDIRKMLDRVGLKSLDDLYCDVPAARVHHEPYEELDPAMSEQEIRDYFAWLAEGTANLKILAGGGVYDHYTPSIIPYLTSRSEFLTAYTPYQAEISQGTLRYIFEYQSLVCRLTGMDASNASLYDGATAAAESMFMALACTRRKTVFLLSETLPGRVIDTVKTYASFHGVELEMIPAVDGQTSLGGLTELLASGNVAGALIPQTNRYGIIEDLTGMADALHASGALLALYSDPSTLAVLKSPAEWGADIALGDAQSLGMPLSFGGPYAGFMACKMEHVRKLPGRVVGETVDRDGKRCYCLTLQAREQHIRREKATSNICSNESLMALWATIYVSLMGNDGLEGVNRLSAEAAHILHDKLISTPYFEPAFPGKPFLKEFTLRYKGGFDNINTAEELFSRMAFEGYVAALPMGDDLVSFAATEKIGALDIEDFVHLFDTPAE